jgi:Carboxypeptidase regulatory-like domain/TonB dependent receptor
MSGNVLNRRFPFTEISGISGGCMHRFAFRFAGLFLLVLFAGYAFSQGTQAGGIAGLVKDSSGALISGADIAIVNDATGAQERTMVTSGDGAFTASLLRPGDYTVTIKAQGFKTYTAKVPVRLNEVTRMDANLVVGGTAEVIEVQANSTMVNTESATTGQPIDAATLRALPLPVPNFLFLLSLSTGTAGEMPDPRAANRGTVDINVNGQRTSNNAMTLEGINVNDFNLAHFDTVPLPNPNAIEEFKVATSLYDASSGSKGGGAVGLVFKSGTKDYHGEAYWQHRNDALNANEWFFNHTGLKRQKFLQNVLGFSGSGPVPLIGGNIFGNVQGLRARNGVDPNSASTTLNSLIFPTNPDGTTSAALLAPGAGVSPSQIDPTALAILNLKSNYYGGQFLVPRVGQTGCAPTSATNLRCNFAKVAPVNDTQYVISYDKPFFGGKSKIGGRWFYDNGDTNKPFGTASTLAFPQLSIQKNRFLSITETQQISNRQLNEFRVGYSRFISSFLPQDIVNLSDINATRPNASTVPGMFRVDVTSAFSIGTGVNDERGTVSNAFVYGDTWSMSIGRHNLKVGGEADRYQLNRFNKFAIRGALTFNNFTNFVKGQIDSEQSASGDPQRYFRATDLAFFAQDDYRLFPTFTLNMGVRWDGFAFAHDKLLRSTIFDPTLLPGNPFIFAENSTLPGITGTKGIGDCGIKNCRDTNNFGPRVGFAWDIFKNQKTVLRGGYGIYFQRLSNQNFLQGSLGPPFFVQLTVNAPSGVTLANPIPNQPATSAVDPTSIPQASHFVGVSGDINKASGIALFANDSGTFCQNFAPTGAATATNCSINLASFSTVPPDAHSPYNQQWNLSIQRELGRAWALEVGYVGAHYVGGLGIYVPFLAPLASPSNPITVKDTSGKSYAITTNTINNEALRSLAFGLSRRRGARIDGNIGQAIYHSGQLTLSHRFQHGLYFQAGYTYSHTIDNVSGSQGTDELNVTQSGQGGANVFNFSNDLRQNRARGDFDRPHRFVLSYNYDLPVPNNGIWGSQLFQGWSLSGIATYQNGLPFSVTDPNGGRVFGGGTSTGRLLCSLDQANTHGDIHNRLDNYLNAACFDSSALAPNSDGTNITDPTNSGFPSVYGNTPRNAFRGPFQTNWDMSVLKHIKIYEKHALDFRADFFNAFNHPSFRQPSVVAIQPLSVTLDPKKGPGTFSQINSTVNPARLIQFGLRYSF